MKSASTLKTTIFAVACALMGFSFPCNAQSEREPYYFLYTNLISESPVRHIYSSTILFYENNSEVRLSPQDAIKLQWVDQIAIERPELIKLYGKDAILRSTYVWTFDSKDKAEKEKRAYMAKSRTEDATVIVVSFSFYKD